MSMGSFQNFFKDFFKQPERVVHLPKQNEVHSMTECYFQFSGPFKQSSGRLSISSCLPISVSNGHLFCFLGCKRFTIESFAPLFCWLPAFCSVFRQPNCCHRVDGKSSCGNGGAYCLAPAVSVLLMDQYICQLRPEWSLFHVPVTSAGHMKKSTILQS